MERSGVYRLPVWRRSAGVLFSAAMVAFGASAEATQVRVRGTVASGDAGLGGYTVDLYRSRAGRGALLLGSDVTSDSGRFAIRYERPVDPDSVLYLLAHRGPVTMATVLTSSPSPLLRAKAIVPSEVVLNERSTVAVGFALAQFLTRGDASGTRVGLRNAGAMVGDLVEVGSGGIAPVLGLAPNGSRTSTLPTFNALANLVQACVAARRACPALLAAAPGSKGRPAPDTLQAIVNIARNPWRNVDRLYHLSTQGPRSYRPALAETPATWTIALKFLGDGRLNGPGAFEADAQGNVWVTNNYTPGGPKTNVCPGKQVFKFTPTGQTFQGSPYSGGGISGDGFGITFDPKGRLWLGNFGFQSPVCAEGPNAATNNSVSLFRADGKHLSPAKGFTAGKISWPQGTASDQRGNIWIANCGNDSVTIYPDGDPKRARNLPARLLGLDKPFDVAIDGRGRAWVTGNDSGNVAIIDGDQIRRVSGSAFDQPMGIASDTRGNMWIANSALVSVPCPNGGFVGQQYGGSIILITKDGRLAPGNPFTGGGVTSPWGVAVDGNDQVWVANFSNGQGKVGPELMRVSQFCGMRPETCPPGKRTGDPISPATGYSSDALTRMTAVAVDPSGNLWGTNNWKVVPPANNPGGDAIVIFVGIAAPLVTPIIGPPVAAE